MKEVEAKEDSEYLSLTLGKYDLSSFTEFLWLKSSEIRGLNVFAFNMLLMMLKCPFLISYFRYTYHTVNIVGFSIQIT